MSEIKVANAPTMPNQSSKTTNAVANAKKLQFSAFIKADGVQKNLLSTLGDATRAKTFTSSLISAVSTNPALRECEATTIISGALLGESLNLSPSPQLGNYYLVPFNDKNKGKVATFQLGWKGYYQLALRSGQYKNIEAVAIKDGELEDYNPITGDIKLKPISDPLQREKSNTIGYYAFFELVNGFKKAMYWSKEKMEAHAVKYSQGYAADKRKGTSYTFWSKQFDEMALKTMYRQLISKYGIMSIEMQKAYTSDMTITELNQEESEPVYFDAAISIDSDTGEVIENG